MKKRSLFIGPGAPSLMLAVVVVGMSVLGLLALMSARNDARLAQRTGDFTAAQYAAMAQAEYRLAELDAVLKNSAAESASDAEYLADIAQNLPDGMIMTGRIITWEEPMQEGHALRCTVEILPLGTQQMRYRRVEYLFISSGAAWE